MPVDLKTTAGTIAAPAANTIVNFKEARKDNVILSSGGLYIYTLRASPIELRTLNIAAGNAKDSYKLHKSIPTVAKLTSVGPRNLWIASGSASELLVWSYQPQTLTTYFKWSGVSIHAVEWVKTAQSQPSLVVLYSKEGSATKIGVINTQKVMTRYSKAGIDATAIEIETDDVNEPNLTADGATLLAASSFGDVKAIAVANGKSASANVVFSDNSTAKVTLPKNENIFSIHINDDFFLVVAGVKGSIAVFDLRDKTDLKPILQAELPGAPTHSASLNTVVSYVSEGAVYTLQITKDGVAKLKAVSISLAIQGITLSEDNQAIRVIIDTEKSLNTTVAFDKNAQPVPLEAGKTSAAPAAPPATTAPPPAYTSGRGASPARPPAPKSSSAATTTAATTTAPAPHSASLLKNNTLANVAAPASISAAQTQATQEVDGAIEELRGQLTATQDTVATYAGKTHKMDLEMIIQHALEAQVAELLKLRLPAAAAASAGGASGVDEAFVVAFRSNLATNISAGISAAVDQVADAVVAKIRESGKKSTKKTGTDSLKRRLDEFVGTANETFATALSDRMKNGEAGFKHSVAHLNRANDEAVRILQQQVDDLSAQLRAVAASGIIDEVKRLRKEVAQLKVRANGQAPAPVSPDTIIQTAIATIDAGNVVGGFSYAVAANQPAVVASVLLGTKDQTFDSATLSNDLWSSVLTLGAIGAQNKDEAVAVLSASEVVKDDDTILTANAGKGRVALKSFCQKWKETFASEASLRNQLKSLEIELGTK